VTDRGRLINRCLGVCVTLIDSCVCNSDWPRSVDWQVSVCVSHWLTAVCVTVTDRGQLIDRCLCVSHWLTAACVTVTDQGQLIDRCLCVCVTLIDRCVCSDWPRSVKLWMSYVRSTFLMPSDLANSSPRNQWVTNLFSLHTQHHACLSVA